MLSLDEVLEYIHLRKLGMRGVLWAEGGKLYFAAEPSASGYRREDALYVSVREFLAYMERWLVGFWAGRKSA